MPGCSWHEISGEPAPIPDQVRIDSHQHFWDPELVTYPWMPPRPSVLRRPYLPEDLQPHLIRHNIDACITVQAAHTLEESRWLLELAGRYDFIRGVVAWVDLTDPAVGSVLDDLQRNPKFVGVRHLVHDEPDVAWLVKQDVLRGLQELAGRNLPYDLLFRPVHLPLIPRVVDAVPELRIVIDHIAKPRIASGEFDDWEEGMQQAAAIPQVYVKLSGMITEADHKSWKPEDLAPYVQRVIEWFGPNRLMYGSDWPVCLLAGGYKQVLAAFTQACGPLPQPTRERILGGTAAEFYNITAER
jgi:L-fuconolactonase